MADLAGRERELVGAGAGPADDDLARTFAELDAVLDAWFMAGRAPEQRDRDRTWAAVHPVAETPGALPGLAAHPA